MVGGSEFHRVGPETAKLLCLYLMVLVVDREIMCLSVVAVQKNGGVKQADTFRGKKTWALTTAPPKAYGTHSPGSRQRRSPSEKGCILIFCRRL